MIIFNRHSIIHQRTLFHCTASSYSSETLQNCSPTSICWKMFVTSKHTHTWYGKELLLVTFSHLFKDSEKLPLLCHYSYQATPSPAIMRRMKGHLWRISSDPIKVHLTHLSQDSNPRQSEAAGLLRAPLSFVTLWHHPISYVYWDSICLCVYLML